MTRKQPTPPTTQSTASTVQSTIQSSTTNETSSEEWLTPDSSAETSSDTEREQAANERKEAILALIGEFGKRWLNYSSIGKRNASVVELCTEKAVKNNGLAADPHAEFKGEGKFTLVTQDVDQTDTYLMFGNDVVRETIHRQVLLQLKVVESEGTYKIDEIVLNYVQQAY